MPNHDAVADALARLANGTAEGAPRDVEAEPASVVAEAEDAFDRLSTAATFVDDSGERRLSQAVSAAAESSDERVANRGRELLAALDQLQATVDGETGTVDGERASDHFHRGHATLLTADGVVPER